MTTTSRLTRLFAFALPLIALDQVTKQWIDGRLPYRGSIPLIDGWFALTYARNEGAAWSMFAGHRWPLVLIAAVAAVAITWHVAKHKPATRAYVLSLSLLLAGAVGNLIDRALYGYVIDMFDLQNGSGRNVFPVFNVADICINIGVGLMLLLSFKEARAAKRAEAESGPA